MYVCIYIREDGAGEVYIRMYVCIYIGGDGVYLRT